MSACPLREAQPISVGCLLEIVGSVRQGAIDALLIRKALTQLDSALALVSGSSTAGLGSPTDLEGVCLLLEHEVQQDSSATAVSPVLLKLLERLVALLLEKYLA